MPSTPDALIWLIAALATLGVIARPWGLPEAIWAALGAALVVVLRLLPWRAAAAAVASGLDVYLFLIGMMLLSEVARREGLFDWLAEVAVGAAARSPRRLFALVYLVGIVVTIFMSNDATAVVLTPAVFAAARKARVEPLPYLMICAFVANAASFVLPISNPANIVLYGDHTPPLASWLQRFVLPSLLSIAATFIALRCIYRHRLAGTFAGEPDIPKLSSAAFVALAGILVTACALLLVSSFDIQLGIPTAALGAATVLAVTIAERKSPLSVVQGVSWSIIPLVAGLFVLVGAVARTGLLNLALDYLVALLRLSEQWGSLVFGIIVAVLCNLINNLPAGQIAATMFAQAHLPRTVVDAALIGVDVGPNLSVTGSLATILWLIAVRRDGLNVSFRRFLAVGALTMPPALLLALAVRIATG